jgi:hypothetical protein
MRNNKRFFHGYDLPFLSFCFYRAKKGAAGFMFLKKNAAPGSRTRRAAHPFGRGPRHFSAGPADLRLPRSISPARLSSPERQGGRGAAARQKLWSACFFFDFFPPYALTVAPRYAILFVY